MLKESVVLKKYVLYSSVFPGILFRRTRSSPSRKGWTPYARPRRYSGNNASALMIFQVIFSQIQNTLRKNVFPLPGSTSRSLRCTPPWATLTFTLTRRRTGEEREEEEEGWPSGRRRERRRRKRRTKNWMVGGENFALFWPFLQRLHGVIFFI